MIRRSGDLKTTKPKVEEEGFAILPDVLDHRSISILLDELSGLKPERGKAGLRHLDSHPCVAELAKDERLMNIASEVLGPGTFPFRSTLLDKSRGSNWLITWHQDTALPVREKRQAEGWSSWSVKEGIHYAHAPAAALDKVLALRVHLDDSRAENGPLRVIPGSHCWGVLSDDDLMAIVDRHHAVNCLVDRGGILAMRPLLIHASSKSSNSLPRRVLHIEYISTSELPGGLRLAVPTTPSQT